MISRPPAAMKLPHPLRLLLLIPLAAHALAAPVTPPANLFKDPRFLRDFVGSYGFLSEVEPKVAPDEQAALATIAALFEESKFQQAREELSRFIAEKEKPTDPKVAPSEISPAMIFVMGNLYFQADRPDEARKAFLEAIRRFPRFRRAHTNLAYLYISRNQTDEALPMLRRAVELGENSARVFGLLGYCLLLKNQAVAAESAYRQAYLLDANSRDWKLGLAQSLMAQDKNAEAANLIGSLIAENPNDKQLWLQQTNALLAMERKDEAILNLEILRIKGLADETNLNLLGNLHMDSGEPGLARLAYLAASEKSPTLNTARALQSARILNDAGHPDQAAEFLDRIRPRIPESAPAADRAAFLLAEARVARSRDNLEASGLLLAQALELLPADPEALLENARHLDLLARNEENPETRARLIAEAKTHFQLAAREESCAYPAHLALGQMLVRERRYSEALPHLQNALEKRKSESLEQYVARVRRAADRLEDRAAAGS
jgi:tetratricopeptide (TPR) repeat protein